MTTISTLEVEIEPKVFGHSVRDIIAMAQEIKRGGYDPDSPDWNAYKAGYMQGREDAFKEYETGLRLMIDDFLGKDL